MVIFLMIFASSFSVLEPARSGLEPPFRAPIGCAVDAARSGLERPCRAPLRLQAGSNGENTISNRLVQLINRFMQLISRQLQFVRNSMRKHAREVQKMKTLIPEFRKQ